MLVILSEEVSVLLSLSTAVSLATLESSDELLNLASSLVCPGADEFPSGSVYFCGANVYLMLNYAIQLL